MPAFILTKRSVILCPHGGAVSHTPMSFSNYRVSGDVPLLWNDVYWVVGCPNQNYPCGYVTWVNPSTTLLVNGIPALLNTSVGFCQSIAGPIQGSAVIMSFQTAETNPEYITSV